MVLLGAFATWQAVEIIYLCQFEYFLKENVSRTGLEHAKNPDNNFTT
ncbi:hypothetical protein MAR621_03647 [Maribacter dokdonensis]|nr:hypothetical protein MAR621_03647 [Maribacter dokdonensis]